MAYKPVIAKAKHQIPLTRRNLVIPIPRVSRLVQPTVIKPPERAVVKPASKLIKAPIVKLDYAPRQPPAVQAPIAKKFPKNKESKRLKGKGVRFLTSDTTAAAIEKILSIRGMGVGRDLVIVGNGPSVSEAGLEKLVGAPRLDTMSINRPYDGLWPTTHWLFCDPVMLTRYKAYWDNYSGWIFNSTSIKQQRTRSMQVKNITGHGFSKDLASGFHIGRSSVYAAMQVAHWLGYDNTFIFGCDMCAVGDKTHFYGVNPDVTPEKRLNRFDGEAAYYQRAGETLPQEDREKYHFCSGHNTYQFVDLFRRWHHSDACQRILASRGILGVSDGKAEAAGA